jgi:hypothetical protein
VQVTRDGGKTWDNVAPSITGAPTFSWISSIAASRKSPGTAYLTIDQHRLDDFAPYVFVTQDFGRTWRTISSGLRGYAHIVLEDPKSPSLLYVGTEVGIFASFDDGATWMDLRLGLPPISVVDMKVHPRDNDLVIATHARGFYILDDVTALQRMASSGFKQTEVMFFEPMPAVRYNPASDTSVLGNRVWVARNQPYGAILNYYLPKPVPGGVRFEVADASGRAVQTLSGPGQPGVNRTVWNLSEASSCRADPGAAPQGRGRSGRGGRGGGAWVRAIPGTYSVRLTALGKTLEQSVTVRLDPRVEATTEDMQVWHREARTIERTECIVRRAAADLGAFERELDQVAASGGAAREAQVDAIRRELRPIALVLRGDSRDPGHVNLPGRINWLTIQVGNYSGRPTAAQLEWIAIYAKQAEEAVAALGRLRGRLQETRRSEG